MCICMYVERKRKYVRERVERRKKETKGTRGRGEKNNTVEV